MHSFYIIRRGMNVSPYFSSLISNPTTIFWHVNIADGLEKQILSGQICGINSRGRQRTKYTDSLNSFVTRKESSNNELIRRTDDREDRKAMTADHMMMMMMMMMMIFHSMFVNILDFLLLNNTRNLTKSMQV